MLENFNVDPPIESVKYYFRWAVNLNFAYSVLCYAYAYAYSNREGNLRKVVGKKPYFAPLSKRDTYLYLVLHLQGLQYLRLTTTAHTSSFSRFQGHCRDTKIVSTH